MRFMLGSLLIILTVLSDSFSFDLKCKYDYGPECFVSDLVITNQDAKITSINGLTVSELENTFLELIIRNQEVHFIPKNIATFFPRLEILEISNSSLRWIEQADIKELTSLKTLNLQANSLEILEEGLFDFNTELTTISIGSNRLIFIHEDIFYGLSQLETIALEHNPCTINFYNEHYFRQAYDDRYNVKNFLNSYCQSWKIAISIHDGMLRQQIDNLRSENEKLTHRLKTCDGNLDAALTNFHQQKSMASTITFPDKPHEPPTINLECANEKCVAHDFKVSFANSSIETELFKGQFITSLQIHQQQALFLPQKLAEHFPQLNYLSVTESGLCEIDYDVLEGLALLTLNLTSNKIPEIPIDTFAKLSDLEVLDLSFNKIDSLSGDVFASLTSLQELYLNNNYLTSIQVEVVNNLKSLNGLFLQGNRLKFISATLLTPLISLVSLDLSDNLCIDMSYPITELVDIEATIIDNCIAPVELTCKSDSTEGSEYVGISSFCNVEELFIEYPKTKISKLRNGEPGLNESMKVFFADKQSIGFFPYQLSQQFPNLERIEIQQSNLTSLHQMDFEGFSKLTEIVINHNHLSSIGDGTFDTIPQLELLDLSSNGIAALPKNVFARLTCLHTLILSDNRIVKFMADFLPRKNVIEVFRSDNNQLEFIETKTVRFLRKAKLIDLSGNVCIDLKFAKTENRTRALVELSGEIDLNCSADD